jgi:hypothetical protein
MEDKFVDFTDEELLLELINRNVMSEAPKKTGLISPRYEVSVAIGNNETARIKFLMEAFSELCDIVYKREHEEELLPCPNSDGQCPDDNLYVEQDENGYWSVYCDYCGYRAPSGSTRKEAIRRHNMIARGSD